MDILNGLGMKFGGESHKYWSWFHYFNSRVDEADLSDMGQLFALQANTTGAPQRIVDDYLVAGIADAEHALSEVWETLRNRYGSNTQISSHLIDRIRNTEKINDVSKIDKMQDLLGLCKVARANMRHCSNLRILELPHGMEWIWQKLPRNFIDRWRREATKFERNHGETPSLSVLITSMSQFIDEFSNPGYNSIVSSATSQPKARTFLTETKSNSSKVEKFNKSPNTNKYCPFHNSKTHDIYSCVPFAKLSYQERRQVARDQKLCYDCLGSHLSNVCPKKIICNKCQRYHSELMHNNENPPDKPIHNIYPKINHPDVKNLCTTICDSSYSLKTCSKTVPVEVRVKGHPDSIRVFCIIDEQSNKTFIDDSLIEKLDIPDSNIKPNTYTLSTLSKLTTTMQGKLVSGLEVRGLNQGISNWIDLPTTFTHPSLPNTKDEIATSHLVRLHSHVSSFAHNFLDSLPDYDVALLIGTNCGEAMRTRSFGSTAPFVHKTALGWALVGPSCLDRRPQVNRVLRTGAASQECEHFSAPLHETFPNQIKLQINNSDPFIEKADDELLGPSKEDTEFHDIMENNVTTNSEGNFVLPLPFKRNAVLPDNKIAVYTRSKNTLNRILRDSDKADKCAKVMEKYIAGGHVEQVPDECIETSGMSCYLNVFPVAKKNADSSKIRLVFDSSAKFKGVSLNDCLIQGPDEMNRIVAVMLRFRHEEIAFTADIECMFHAFHVSPAHHDALRFFWWTDNVPSSNISIYRAKVHVFGNKSSPAVATWGLRHAATMSEANCSPEAKNFIREKFYVDDGMGSETTVQKAIETLSEARRVLSQRNMRLHKIISTHPEVLKAFPSSEVSENIDRVDFNLSPNQRALGIIWKITSDEFILHCDIPERKFTKRGVFSVNGSLYDPLGIASPVTLKGRLLQRDFFPSKANINAPFFDWDDKLPDNYLGRWSQWLSELDQVDCVSIPRCFHPPNYGKIISMDLHVFADASEKSIGLVMYLRQVNYEDQVCVAFVFANSKVAPRAAVSMPRLELCAATEAAQSTTYILSELRLPIDNVYMYSDSKVTLGYICNKERRFSRYVTSRVQSITKASTPEQWNYINSCENPADIASRPHSPQQLIETCWLEGPDFLWKKGYSASGVDFNLSDSLPEQQEEALTLRSKQSNSNEITKGILEKSSDLIKATAVLKNVFIFVHRIKKVPLSDIDAKFLALRFFIREAQEEIFPDTYHRLYEDIDLKKSDQLTSLCPFLDEDDLIRVGGRLRNAQLSYAIKHPILLPAKHKITLLLLRFYHEKTHHSGRHLTAASMREGGYHIHRQKQVIGQFLKNCVTCQKLRGNYQTQKMADLPVDRLEQVAPFTNTGMDVFGPYIVHDGKNTRRSTSSKKVWVLLFTCLVSRAIHMESLSSMDTSTFRLALRRFFAIRGTCKRLRSDHGSNFIGARNQMQQDIDLDALRKQIEDEGCVWELNPPYASHCAGVWERKIGDVKKVFHAAMSELKLNSISRDEFNTLLQETASIVNNTPLFDISSDPNDPYPVSPAVLLTLRDDAPSCPPEAFDKKDLLRYGKLRWRRVQYLSDQFWVRWRRDYVLKLQERNKWRFSSPNLKVNDIVLVKCNSPRNEWPIGRIVESYPSSDGLVRTVKIQLKASVNGIRRYWERSIHDLVLLISCDSST